MVVKSSNRQVVKCNAGEMRKAGVRRMQDAKGAARGRSSTRKERDAKARAREVYGAGVIKGQCGQETGRGHVGGPGISLRVKLRLRAEECAPLGPSERSILP